MTTLAESDDILSHMLYIYMEYQVELTNRKYVAWFE